MLLLAGNVFKHQPVHPSCFPGALKVWGSVLHLLEKSSCWEKALDAGSGQGGGVCLPPWRVKRNRGLERCHGNGFQ